MFPRVLVTLVCALLVAGCSGAAADFSPDVAPDAPDAGAAPDAHMVRARDAGRPVPAPPAPTPLPAPLPAGDAGAAPVAADAAGPNVDVPDAAPVPVVVPPPPVTQVRCALPNGNTFYVHCGGGAAFDVGQVVTYAGPSGVLKCSSESVPTSACVVGSDCIMYVYSVITVGVCR